MVDLDGLKRLNDTLGHARGDDGLQELGTIIRNSIRSIDSAYRYGGDEFTVLLPETDFRGAFVVAEKVRAGAELLGERVAPEGVSLGVSIGLAAFPEDGSTVDELMLAADRALYAAKRAGKNQISGYVDGPRSGPRPPSAPADSPPGMDPTAAEAEPDPLEVRRQIESASQRFDSDVRIRRAVDVFLSPGPESATSVERIA
jgi:diguanylate cyclase (GGDEF)-like protein